ncbi:hypothetical protein EYF80_049557 [Liparis tanakae]|uniref:Uncharacterized protein n=1 Tax=Liparis tanakae TaxID=230148 RepID=A0A4Z2FH83_9TELE|nr:hypothetical protein EYF80_049557 [Liparis tanakae]
MAWERWRGIGPRSVRDDSESETQIDGSPVSEAMCHQTPHATSCEGRQQIHTGFTELAVFLSVGVTERFTGLRLENVDAEQGARGAARRHVSVYSLCIAG